MQDKDIKVALKRILTGERATLEVNVRNWARAQQVYASLSPRMQGLLTLRKVD